MTAKILLIGSIGAGKTSLKQKLLRQALSYRKTQVLEFSDLFIDCPGEYLEIPRYYHVLIDAGHRAAEVWAIQDATRTRSYYPPNFASAFSKPVVGIVTKIDRTDATPARAEDYLRLAGIKECLYRVSAVAGTGVDMLSRRLEALLGYG